MLMASMEIAERNLEWFQHRVEQYRSKTNDLVEAIEDFDDMDKLGLGFTSVDPLEEVDIGDGSRPRPTFVNKNLSPMYHFELINLLKEYPDCFAWEYSEMPGLSRSLLSIGCRLRRDLGWSNSQIVALILTYMTELKKRLIGYLKRVLFVLADMRNGVQISCRLRRRIRERLEYVLISVI
jgi:hypothetical protein